LAEAFQAAHLRRTDNLGYLEHVETAAGGEVNRSMRKS
jgi:hypothetical protein